MIIRVITVHSGRTQRLKRIGSGLSMIDEGRTCRCRRILTILDETVGRVREGAGLPGVVGSGGRDDDAGAFGFEHLGCVDEVGFVREDGLGDTAEFHQHSPHTSSESMRVHSLISRLTSGGIVVVHRITIGAPVICRRQTPAIIVPKLNDDIIARFERAGDGVEAAFARVAACGAARDGLVVDSDVHVVDERGAPAFGAVVVAGRDHRAVAGEVEGLRCGARHGEEECWECVVHDGCLSLGTKEDEWLASGMARSIFASGTTRRSYISFTKLLEWNESSK